MDYVFKKKYDRKKNQELKKIKLIELRHMGISLKEYRHQNTWVTLSIEGPLIIAGFMKRLRQA